MDEIGIEVTEVDGVTCVFGEIDTDTMQATSTSGRFSLGAAWVDVTRMKDLVCPECSSSISFASASKVASCTLCGADLDLSSAEQVAPELAPAGEVRED